MPKTLKLFKATPKETAQPLETAPGPALVTKREAPATSAGQPAQRETVFAGKFIRSSN